MLTFIISVECGAGGPGRTEMAQALREGRLPHFPLVSRASDAAFLSSVGHSWQILGG